MGKLLNWAAITAVLLVLLGDRLMGSGAISKADDAKKLADNLRDAILKSCVSARQDRAATALDRKTLYALGQTLIDQPAQLVNPAARAARTKYLRDTIAPLAQPLATNPPCKLTPSS